MSPIAGICSHIHIMTYLNMLGTGIEQTIKMQYFKVIVIKLVQKAVQLIKSLMIWHQFS